eukprot:gene11677-biopygen8457
MGWQDVWNKRAGVAVKSPWNANFRVFTLHANLCTHLKPWRSHAGNSVSTYNVHPRFGDITHMNCRNNPACGRGMVRPHSATWLPLATIMAQGGWGGALECRPCPGTRQGTVCGCRGRRQLAAWSCAASCTHCRRRELPARRLGALQYDIMADGSPLAVLSTHPNGVSRTPITK